MKSNRRISLQTYARNAAFYKNLGCCWILKQNNLDDNKIKNSLVNIIENEEDYLIKKNKMNNFIKKIK